MPSNPFRVQRLGPHGCAYAFPPDLDRVQLLCAVEAAGWNAEIRGPHGVGKSTLMQTLGAEARARGKRVAHWQCRTDASTLPPFWRLRIRACDVLLMDGAETLAPRTLAALRRTMQRRSKGLVITTHERAGHGHVVHLEPSQECFAAMVAERLADQSPEFRGALARFLGHAPEETIHQTNGNAREAFFKLYDACEAVYGAPRAE